jgi:hypothetical protein
MNNRKCTTIGKVFTIAAALTLGLAITPTASAQYKGCSNASLRGSFSQTGSGNGAYPARRQPANWRAQPSLSVFPSEWPRFPIHAPWRIGQFWDLHRIARQPQPSGETVAIRCQSGLRAATQRAARLSLVAARSVCTEPPATSIRFSVPSASNPIDLESGDQNEPLPFSVPGNSRDVKEFISRSHSLGVVDASI